MIGGDIGNGVYSAFQIAQIVKPALAASSGFTMASCVLGTLGGALNIGVGVYCLTQARQAYKDLTKDGKAFLQEHGYIKSFWLLMKGDALEDVEKYMRLLWDGIFLIAIGIFMILVSLALKVAVLAGLGAFLAANPYFLPILWFLISVPLLLEVSRNNLRIFRGEDKASQLKFDQLKKELEKETVDWEKINQFYAVPNNPFNFEDAKQSQVSSHESDAADKVSDKMQEFQVSMGPEAAIEAMTLKHCLMEQNKEKAVEQIEIVEAKINKWNFAQKVRLLQQILLVLSLVTGLLLLTKSVSTIFNLITNGLILLGGGLIPLATDIAWPFKRNIYMVVPKAEADQVMHCVQEASENALKLVHRGKDDITFANLELRGADRVGSVAEEALGSHQAV